MKITSFITSSSAVKPNDMALSPDGTTLYVAFADNSAPAKNVDFAQPSSFHQICPVDHGICAFNASTLALTATVKGIGGTLAVSQDGKSLYVSLPAAKVYVVNTSTLAISAIGLPNALSPVDVVVSPVGNAALVYASSSGGLGPLTTYVLNTSTNQLMSVFPAAMSGATVGGFYGFASFTPDGSAVWISVTCPYSTAGCTGRPSTLIGQTFPGGKVIGQTALPDNSYFLTL